MDILLIAGLWLDGSAWDNVAAQLEARGHRAVPVTLPGQGDGNTSATLADQVGRGGRGGRCGCGQAHGGGAFRCLQPGVDRRRRPRRQDQQGRPDRRLPLPRTARHTSAAFPVQDGAMPFPGWGEFEGPDSADLDDAAKRPSRRRRSRCRKGSLAE